MKELIEHILINIRYPILGANKTYPLSDPTLLPLSQKT